VAQWYASLFLSFGFAVKGRCRTRRGHKHGRSAVDVGGLLAWCGAHVDRDGSDLSVLRP
jgi:hypothetical protein